MPPASLSLSSRVESYDGAVVQGKHARASNGLHESEDPAPGLRRISAMSRAGCKGLKTSDNFVSASEKAETIDARNSFGVAKQHDGQTLDYPGNRNSAMAPGGQGERPCAYGKAGHEDSLTAYDSSSHATLESDSVLRFNFRAAVPAA